jgi:hypothetical protein
VALNLCFSFRRIERNQHRGFAAGTQNLSDPSGMLAKHNGVQLTVLPESDPLSIGREKKEFAALSVSRIDYAQLLVRFGVTVHGARPPAGSSTTFRMLKRRLDMLQDVDTHTRRLSWRWLAAAMVIAVSGGTNASIPRCDSPRG